MSLEQATFFIGVAVLAVQGFNAYVTLGLKLWTIKNFVAKEDMVQYISPLRETIQALQSEDRLRHNR